MIDLYHNFKVSQILMPAVRTADANSSSIDRQGFDSVMFIASVGLSADTLSGSVYAEFEVEESDDNSAWTDVANADLFKSVTGTNVGTFAKIDDPAEDETHYFTAYRGTKRYCRVVYNVTGTHSSGTPVAVIAVQGNARKGPATA